MSSGFIRLVNEDEKDLALVVVVGSIRSGDVDPSRFFIRHQSLIGDIPGSPFAYWVEPQIVSLFASLPKFESNGRTAKNGLSSADDFRFVRTWWEVQPSKSLAFPLPESQETTDYSPQVFRKATFTGRKWIPLIRGGRFSPYFSEITMVVNWERDGEEMKQWATYRNGGGHWSRNLKGVDSFFLPGLTWPLRGKRFSAQLVPPGTIFSVGGKMAFFPDSWSLNEALGLFNADIFDYLIGLFAGKIGGVQYQSGLIGGLPYPLSQQGKESDGLELQAVEIGREIFRNSELSRYFTYPGLLLSKHQSLKAAIEEYGALAIGLRASFEALHEKLNIRAIRAYGLDSLAHDHIRVWLGVKPLNQEESEDAEDSLPDTHSKGTGADVHVESTSDLLSYAIGSVLGRWDVRMVLDPSVAPPLQAASAPLSVCPPGFLVGVTGLSAGRNSIVSEEWLRTRPNVISLPPNGSVTEQVITDEKYPLRIEWDGILVDDEGHEADVVRRVRDVLALLWHDRAEAIEQEACEILSVRGLREYFRNPKGFWDFHVKRYSKSGRKAPIYWLLQSRKRAYGLWLYYPRLDADTLFKALGYVGNRLLLEQGRLEEALGQRREIGEGDARIRRELDKRIEAHEAFISEVAEFRTELQRVADLGLTVDHDDGVLLSIAPLHNLVPWPLAKAAWNELLAGKYGWSSMGKQLRAQGLVREKSRG